jgi:hypothetical protein
MTRPHAGAPTVPCRVCGAEGPAGAFCGSCGERLPGGRGDQRGRLRMAAYAAAPEEPVLRLSVASSLFPHLPHRLRAPFRAGLAVLFLALVVLALLRWQAPLIAVAALGFPLLFVIYLRESDVFADLPVSTLAATAVLGVGLGAGWALLTGTVVAHAHDVALGPGEEEGHMPLEVLAIPIGGAVLMLVPAVLTRLLRFSTRESLDGFVIGSLGAIGFTAAATLIRLAPQFATGVTADDRPVKVLLVQAGIQGVAAPLTAAAVGGLFGAALWFTRSPDAPGRQRGAGVVAVLSSALFALALYAALGLVEFIPLLAGLHLGMHLVIAVVAFVALRIGLQAALLHEAPDAMRPSEQVPCPHCDHLVPDMAFCTNCGAAARAASRSSRAERKSAAAERGSTTRPLVALGAGMTVAVAAAVTASVLATPADARYVCPPHCGRPPIGVPVETNPRFTAANGEFSVSYPGEGTAYESTLNPDGVVLDYVSGDTGTLELFGQPAADRTPQQIAEDLITESYPEAVIHYEIPNALVGYQPGYGVVADEYPQDASGSYTRLRVLVMVGVKNDYALIAAAVGPYHEFSPDYGSGHPSGANLELALDMGKYVNSFTWRDDPPH